MLNAGLEWFQFQSMRQSQRFSALLPSEVRLARDFLAWSAATSVCATSGLWRDAFVLFEGIRQTSAAWHKVTMYSQTSKMSLNNMNLVHNSLSNYSQLMIFLSFGSSGFPTTDINRLYNCFDAKLKV